MRVIRPRALTPAERRRALILALSMLAAGALAVEVTILVAGTTVASGVAGGAAALGLGIGTAWLVRTLRPNRTRDIGRALVELLAPTLDDSYTLIVGPRLPVRDSARLDGVLIGPGGVRILTARDWEGRYRVRGRSWQFDAGRRGWVRCRTNPSFDAAALVAGVARWAEERGLRELPMKAAIAFPRRHSRVVLEEPDDEVVTVANAPWWANTVGRVKRLDDGVAARLTAAVLDEAERSLPAARAGAVERSA